MLSEAIERSRVGSLFVQCCADPSASLRSLIPLVMADIRARHHLDTERPVGEWLASLADDPLCLLLLSESLNTDLPFERVCTRVRRACLDGLPIEPARYPLLAALALQAWNNEYVWEETAEETAAIEAALWAGDLGTLPLLRWAMYRPLAAFPVAEALATWPLESVPPVLHPLWRRTLLAPREETALRDAMPTFGPITDATSRAVRAQYEEHPYPRWLRLSGVQKSVLARHRAYDPAFAWPFRSPLQILVAGCGTGKRPLQVARENPDAEVLAVDLSAASLAYAQRMARELGIDNVRFVQADLLQLPAMGRQFHHIDCSGVLPCVHDQQAAWQALTDVLQPGGTLSLAVYSTVARLAVTHLRARIARDGVPSTPSAMRAFRAQLLREPGSATFIDLAGDLFSLSMVRDLLFHVHEHQHTVAELEQQATACGLRLLGYRRPRRVARPSGPPTFAQWRALEVAYTGSMEMFFCTLVAQGEGHRPDSPIGLFP